MNTLPQFSAPNTGALRFADIDGESVTVAHDAALSAANWTVEAWVTTTNTDGDFNRIVVKNVGGSQTYSLLVINGEAQVRSSVGDITSTGLTVADGVPHHIAGVYDSVAETLALYVDGALFQSISTAGQTLDQGTEDVFIGDATAPFLQAFDGDISDVRIWSDVRTTEEIAETFDQPLSSGADNLELHLRFDGDATDSSGNGRDGVINGAPVFVEGLAPVDPLPFVPVPVDAVEDLTKPITGLRVADADPGAFLSVSLDVAFGVLTLTETLGVTFSGGLNGSNSFTIDGTVEDLNAALATLTYRGDPEFDGFDNINLFVDDGVAPVAEPISGDRSIPNAGFYFVVDFDSGLTTAEPRVGGAPPASAPTNGVHIQINPNNTEWVAEAVLYVGGATSTLDPSGFNLAGYGGAQSISGSLIQFDDAVSGATLTFTDAAVPTPTGVREVTFTFTNVVFSDAPPGVVDISSSSVAISSFTDTTIPITVATANDAPVAVDDLLTADEDTGVSGNLLVDNGNGGDFDIDTIGPLSVVEIDGVAVVDGETVTLASGAQLTINSNGAFAYDPAGQFEGVAAGQTGADSFTYTITDGEASSAQEISGGLSIQDNAAFIVDFDTGLTASEPNFGASVPPVNGVVITLSPNLTDFEVVAEIYENGVQSFASGDFILADYFGASGPTVAGQRFSFEDAFADLTLTWQRANVPSPTGPRDVTFTFEAVTFADDGLGVATVGNSLVQDNTLARGTGVVNLTINGANDAPIAADDNITTDEDTIVSGSLLDDNGFGPDLDIDNGAILGVTEIDGIPVFDGEVVSLASGAQLTIRQDGTFDYDPNGAFETLPEGAPAPDSFTYTIADEFGATSTATAFVTVFGVNDAPVAQADTFIGDEDTIVSGDLFADNGFGPDVDADGPLTISQINGVAVTNGEVVTLQSGATLTIRTDGTFDFDPTVAFDFLRNGANGLLAVPSFEYTVVDDQGATATAFASINLTGLNDAPVAIDDFFVTDEDSVVSGSLLAENGVGADSDVDRLAVLTVTEINGTAVFDGEPVLLPSGAILLIRADGTFDYDPNGAFGNLAEGDTAPDSFTYTIADEIGATASATANVTTFGVNAAPIAFDENFELNSEAPVFGNLLSDANSDGFSVGDPDGDMLSLSQINGAAFFDGEMISLPSGAILGINSDGTFDYSPQGQVDALAPGETATDSFTYQVSDGFGGLTTATVNFTFASANNAPVAFDDNINTDENNFVSGDLLADNGFGPDADIEIGAVLGVTEINGAPVADGQTVFLASGAVLIIRSDGTFDYDPNGAFEALVVGESAIDSFTYTIADELGATATATANVTVVGANAPPQAFDETFDLDEGAPLFGDLLADTNSDGFVAFDPDGDALSISQINGAPIADGQVVSLFSGAQLTIRLDGTFTYDPAGAFEALGAGAQAFDDFSYTIVDEAGDTATATAIFTIIGANDAPVAANDNFATASGVAFSGDLIADNGFGPDSDIDAGAALTVTEINGAAVANDEVVTLPSGAVLIIRADGTFDYDPVGAVGSDAFAYTISDGFGGTSSAFAEVVIESVNTAPDARNDAFDLDQNDVITGNFFADNGQGADTDINNDDLSIIQIADLFPPQGGAPITVTFGSGAVVTFASDGAFTYDASAAFAGLGAGEVATDQFTYLVSDQQGGTSEASVTFNVTGAEAQNTAPVARDDTFSTDEDTAIGGLFLLADNGAGADADEDGDDLSLISIEGEDISAGDTVQLASGAVITIGDEGDIAYDPNASFETLQLGETATDSFVYQISDGQGGTSEATVRVEVAGASDILFGSDEVDFLEGTANADDIRALDGGDFVSGFGGDDIIDGGAGDDRARGGQGEDSISGGEGNDALFGEGGDDILSGGDGNDRLRGQRGDDMLFGGDGDDVLAGARDADILVGGDGADTLAGGGGNDQLRGQAGDDKLGGSRGDDILLGGLGADRIRGGGGEDTLIGGADDDTLIGGAGNDVFQFSDNDGSDVIRRFQHNADLIQITSDEIDFADLTIVQQGANVLISFGAGDLLMTAQTSSDFGVEDFIFL